MKADRVFSSLLLLLLALLLSIPLALGQTDVAQASPSPLNRPRISEPNTPASQTLTVTAIRDAWINSGQPGKNYGGCDTLTVGSQVAPAESWRTLLRFDLSGLPEGAQILSAHLRLTKVGGALTAQSVTAHEVTSPWVEGSGGCTGAASQSNWTQSTLTETWTTPGGDFDPIPLDTVAVAGLGAYSWDIKAAVAQWSGQTATNLGVLLTTGGGNGAHLFGSREHGLPTRWPQLVVTYQAGPAGVGDRVWHDKNRNNVQESGEAGLAGAKISLYTGRCDAVGPLPAASTVTDGDGRYFFVPPGPGDFCLVVDPATLPADYGPTRVNSPRPVTWTPGQRLYGVDFGFITNYGAERATVGLYAPCLDFSWLDLLISAHGLAMDDRNHLACDTSVVGTESQIDAFLAAARADSRTRYAKNDVYVLAAFVPNDPDYNNPAVVYGPQAINAPAAWDLTQGDADLIVAVLDTGVDLSHPEFAGRLLPGYDFVDDDADPTDQNGHGTHIAGILAAGIDNGLGIAGMAGRVKILPVRVLNSANAGWMSDIAAGVTWAVDQGARVINLSLGSSTASTALATAIDYANSQGAVVIAAAGNANSAAPFYPAAWDRVIATGASSYTGGRWTLSNRGDNVDLMAPGALIYSTAWSPTGGGVFDFNSGTSMAAPHVAGVVALMLSRDPNLTWDQVKTILQTQVTDLGDPGWDSLYGYGLADAGGAVSAVANVAVAAPVTDLAVELVSDLNGNGLVDPGDTIRYVVVVANDSPDALNDVTVSALLPPGATYVPGSTQINGVPVKDSVAPEDAFPLNDSGGLAVQPVPPLDSHKVSFNVVVESPGPGLYRLESSVTVANPAGSETLQQSVPLAGTLLLLAASPLDTQAGNRVTYTLTTAYLGGELLAGVVISDRIPVGMVYVPDSANAGGTEDGGVVTWQLGSSLAPQSATSGLGHSAANAWPTLVSTGGLITVTHFVSATPPVATLTPTLTITPSAGVDIAYVSGPTPASQTVDSQGITVTWLYRVASTTDQIGQVRFGAGATGDGQPWPVALSNSVIVHPPLTFQTALESPSGSVGVPDGVTNMAFIYGSGGHLLAPASNTVFTSLASALGSDLGSRVWWDINGDGRQDPGEPGIPLVMMDLLDSSGTPLATTSTDSEGVYLFPARPGGSYTITVGAGAFAPGGVLEGWTASPRYVGDGSQDSDGDPDTNGTSVSVSGGQPALTVDFGFTVETAYTSTQEIHGGSPVRFGGLFSMGLAISNGGRTWLRDLPVTVEYDPAFLAFQDASLPPDDPTDDGSLAWADVLVAPELAAAALGAIGPSQGQEITLTFRAIQDTGVLPGEVSPYTITLASPHIDADGGYGPLAPVTVAGQRVVTGQVTIINPTGVAVMDAGVRVDGEMAHLFWRTQDESNISGFRLLRRGDGGEPIWLTPAILPAQHAGQPLGGDYRHVDRLATVENPAYVLVILEADGSQIQLPLGHARPRERIFFPLLMQER